jgi:hypothetical protein
VVEVAVQLVSVVLGATSGRECHSIAR